MVQPGARCMACCRPVTRQPHQHASRCAVVFQLAAAKCLLHQRSCSPPLQEPHVQQHGAADGGRCSPTSGRMGIEQLTTGRQAGSSLPGGRTPGPDCSQREGRRTPSRAQAETGSETTIRRGGVAQADGSCESSARGLDSYEEGRRRLYHSFCAGAVKSGSGADGAVGEVEIAGVDRRGLHSQLHSPIQQGTMVDGDDKNKDHMTFRMLRWDTQQQAMVGRSQGHHDLRGDSRPPENPSRRSGSPHQRHAVPCDEANAGQRLKNHSGLRAQLSRACSPSCSSRSLRTSRMVTDLRGAASGRNETHSPGAGAGEEAGYSLGGDPRRLEVTSPVGPAGPRPAVDGLAFQRLALSVQLGNPHALCYLNSVLVAVAHSVGNLTANPGYLTQPLVACLRKMIAAKHTRLLATAHLGRRVSEWASLSSIILPISMPFLLMPTSQSLRRAPGRADCNATAGSKFAMLVVPSNRLLYRVSQV